MADDQKSFWSSVPGILTGLAALITAAAGLLAAFSHFHASPSNAPAPSAVSAPASTSPASVPVPASSTSAPASTASNPASLATSIVGTWSGTPNGSDGMNILNIQQSGSGFTGTFELPCNFSGGRPVDVITPEGSGYAFTISKLGKHPNGEPFPPILLNLQLQNGTLLGTFVQGKRHTNIVYTPGRRPCPH